jgi:hypothetical protein
MALTERFEKTTQIGYWTGEIPLEYIYTYGRAGEAYFRNLMDKGTFLGARCGKCHITYVPPRIYCEQCFARLEESYVDVGDHGIVQTFTVLYKNLDGSKKEKPLAMAMVEIEGTDGGVVHCLGEVEPEEVYIGMEVEAVLKPKAQRQGAITDIKYFKPV